MHDLQASAHRVHTVSTAKDQVRKRGTMFLLCGEGTRVHFSTLDKVWLKTV